MVSRAAEERQAPRHLRSPHAGSLPLPTSLSRMFVSNCCSFSQPSSTRLQEDQSLHQAHSSPTCCQAAVRGGGNQLCLLPSWAIRSTRLARALDPWNAPTAPRAARLMTEASVTLIQTQKQAQPLRGLAWRLRILIWSELFIRWSKCLRWPCHLVMNYEIKGRPPRHHNFWGPPLLALPAFHCGDCELVFRVLLANRDVPWFPLPPAKKPAAPYNSSIFTFVCYYSLGVVWSRHTPLLPPHLWPHCILQSPLPQAEPGRPQPLIFWILVMHQVHFGPYFLGYNFLTTSSQEEYSPPNENKLCLQHSAS